MIWNRAEPGRSGHAAAGQAPPGLRVPPGTSGFVPIRPLYRIEYAFAQLGRWRRLLNVVLIRSATSDSKETADQEVLELEQHGAPPVGEIACYRRGRPESRKLNPSLFGSQCRRPLAVCPACSPGPPSSPRGRNLAIGERLSVFGSSCTTGTPRSADASMQCTAPRASGSSERRSAHLGRTPSRSGSCGPCAESASTTS